MPDFDELLASAFSDIDDAAFAVGHRPKHGDKDQGELIWRQLGAEEGSDGKRHGGSPVQINTTTGEIEKGPSSFVGHKPSEVGKVAKHERTRANREKVVRKAAATEPAVPLDEELADTFKQIHEKATSKVKAKHEAIEPDVPAIEPEAPEEEEPIEPEEQKKWSPVENGWELTPEDYHYQRNRNTDNTLTPEQSYREHAEVVGDALDRGEVVPDHVRAEHGYPTEEEEQATSERKGNLPTDEQVAAAKPAIHQPTGKPMPEHEADKANPDQVAKFKGWQKTPKGPVPLYDLKKTEDHHPEGSTVTARTLENLDLVPPKPQEEPVATPPKEQPIDEQVADALKPVPKPGDKLDLFGQYLPVGKHEGLWGEGTLKPQAKPQQEIHPPENAKDERIRRQYDPTATEKMFPTDEPETKAAIPDEPTLPMGEQAPTEKPKQSPEREATINQILDAASRPTPNMVERKEWMGTDGKWHTPFGVPLGVHLTDESRSMGFVAQDGNGTTYGKRYPTPEEFQQDHARMQKNDRDEFRKHLEEASDEKLQSQADYWLKAKPLGERAAVRSARPAKPKTRTSPRGSEPVSEPLDEQVADAIAEPPQEPTIPNQETTDGTDSPGQSENPPRSGSDESGDGERGRPEPGVSGGGSDRGTIKPPDERIITARADLSKPADPSLVPERLRQYLAPHQVQASAKAIDAMDKHGGFLLASGTGSGKTRSELAVAAHHAANGRKVLLITKAEVLKPDWKKGTVSGSFKNDSATMDVPVALTHGESSLEPGKVAVSTYDHLSKLLPHVDRNTVLIFDESHALKNSDSIRSKHGRDMMEKAHSVMYATATPADKPLHIAHLFRAKVFGGRRAEETYRELGMEKKSIYIPGRGNISKWELSRSISPMERYRRLSGLFDRMTEEGLMLKHELDFSGIPINSVRVELPPEAHEQLQRVEDEVRAHSRANEGLTSAQVFMQQRRQQEPFKIPHAIKLAQKDLAEGRSVVIFASRVNESTVGEKGDENAITSEGTAKLLKEALTKAGISRVVELHGGISPAKRVRAMDDFQAATKPTVMIATVESGGTGINLDDVKGNLPRSMVMMTAPFSAVENVQALGRLWRLKTASAPRYHYLFADTAADDRNANLINSKMKTLHATVSGEAGKMMLPSDDMEGIDTTDVAEGPRYQWPALTGQSRPIPQPPVASATTTKATASPELPTRQVSTGKGQRHVYSFTPTEKFWSLRKAGKLPDSVSVRKNDRTGKWEATIWGNNPEHTAEVAGELASMGIHSDHFDDDMTRADFFMDLLATA